MNQEIVSRLQAAIECSVFLNPTEPGLTYDELLEVGSRAGFLAGEVGDAAPYAGARHLKMILPSDHILTSWKIIFYEEPEYRNFDAFDFVISELNARVRSDGAKHAQLDRSVVVERALAKALRRHDIEAAITYQVMSGVLTENGGVLRFFNNGGVRALPSEQRQFLAGGRPMPKPDRARVYDIVRDVIERRIDARPAHIESLDAFAEELDALGYGVFRLWWKQTVAELRRGDAHSAPVSVSVLAAALVEGALTFVVKHARKLSLSVFRSRDFDGDPKTWKLDNLVASASSGGADAILDLPTKNRAELLIRTRQRIHAGRMLSEFPTGVPDIRPEEARDAKATAEQVVRRVLDWLHKFPPTTRSD